MTDPPTDPTDPLDEDARWFRDAVDPVLDARPVPDAWAAVRDQATGVAVSLAVRQRSRRPTHRWLAAAAVVGVLAAIGGAMVATTGGDDDADLAVDGPEGPTGFYVPTDLPDGWMVRSLQERTSTFVAEECPCEQGTWTDGERSISIHRSSGGIAADTSNWEPWSGAPGGRRILDVDQHVRYGWQDGDAETYVVGFGFDTAAEAEPLVSAWVDRSDVLAGPAGWDEVERSSIGSEVEAVASASGTLYNDDLGLEVLFELGPEEILGASPDPFAVAAGDGSEFAVLDGSDRTVLLGGTGLAGAWPGGAVFQMSSYLGEGRVSEGVTETQLIALAAAFQPASAAEWKRFVGEVDTTGKDPREIDLMRRTLIHPTIDGLVFRDGDRLPGEGIDPVDGAGPVPEDELEPPRVTIPAAGFPSRPLPTAPGADEPGSPAVADPVNTLAVETDPLAVTVTTGDPFTIAVTITNQTDRPVSVGSCFPAGASWTLEQDGRPLGSMGAFSVDCGGDRPQLLEPGDTLPVRPPPGVFTFAATTDRGQQIPAGRYEAVIRLAALDEPIRVPVTVVAR